MNTLNYAALAAFPIALWGMNGLTIAGLILGTWGFAHEVFVRPQFRLGAALGYGIITMAWEALLIFG